MEAGRVVATAYAKARVNANLKAQPSVSGEAPLIAATALTETNTPAPIGNARHGVELAYQVNHANAQMSAAPSAEPASSKKASKT